jgi:hypothetical protein
VANILRSVTPPSQTPPPSQPAPPRSSVLKVTPRTGFRAQLSNQSLADLVQMECNAGSSQAVQVTSEGRIGYLYFSAGGLTHAEYGVYQGEAALREMLLWDSGDVKTVYRTRPGIPTITDSWQAVLLRAAQVRDEAAEGFTHEFPDVLVGVTESPTPAGVMRSVSSMNDLPSPAIRLDTSGHVISSQGDPGELAEVIAYVTRLTQLVGDELGLDSLNALECAIGGKVCFAYREPAGWAALLIDEGHGAGELRQRLNLG